MGVEQRALAAACAVAAARGLACEQSVVLRSGSNVLVHLRPAPVVARVMTGTVVLHDDPRRWLEREVSVLGFLAHSGLAVAPSDLIAAGPYEHDGLWMTFVEWLAVEGHAERGDDAAELGRCLRRLHDELLAFSGELGDLRDLRDDIARLLALLRPGSELTGETITALAERLRALDEPAFRTSLPTQALHGDAALSNLLRTRQGYIWNDFEDTFRGPVHWDLAGIVMDLRGQGAGDGDVRAFLDAYGWDDGEEALAPFMPAHEVYYQIWHLYQSQRP